MLQEKLDDEVAKTEVLNVLIENEKQKKEKKIEEIVNLYQIAQDKNSKLINLLKEKDMNFEQKLKDEINNYKKNNDKLIDITEKEKKELKNEINNKNKIIKELNEKIEKLNLELKEYKKDDENNIKKNGYSRLISVMNIETKESKEDNIRNKILDEQKMPENFNFFEKKQLTGKFGGEEESSYKQKSISNEDKKNKDKNSKNLKGNNKTKNISHFKSFEQSDENKEK